MFDLTALWDIHTLIYVILSAIVILVILGLLSATNRRLRMLASDVESLRREMKLVDEGIQSVAQHLKSNPPTQPAQPQGGRAALAPVASEAGTEDKNRATG